MSAVAQGSQPSAKSLPEKFLHFSSRGFPQLRRATRRVFWLGLVSGATLALLSAAAAAA
ncbi:MAG TPA: hypothetical protein QF700_01090 [Prochlorococcus sp.]|nr:hypothetical protein [Prochlorococcus sp.]